MTHQTNNQHTGLNGSPAGSSAYTIAPKNRPMPTLVSEANLPSVYQRIRKINPTYTSVTFGIGALNGLSVNETYYTTVNDPTVGTELFKSDGTLAGTTLIADINLGFDRFGGSPASSFPSNFVALGNQVLFTADRNEIGRELWISDGTRAGTQLVKDLTPDLNDNGYARSTSPYNLTSLGNQAVFIARTTEMADELWRTDGTAAGTQRLVSNLIPGSNTTALSNFVPFKNQLLFSSSSFGQPAQLWKTDGTASGTSVISTFENISLFFSGQTFKGEFYFAASDREFGQELWKTDGTEAGTQRVSDAAPGIANSSPSNFVVFGDNLLFQTAIINPETGFTGSELWKTNGTIGGTEKVTSISSLQIDPVVSGNHFYYFDSSTNSNVSLWKSDGTLAGTQVVKEIQAGFKSPSRFPNPSVENPSFFIPSKSPGNIVAANGRIFFTANDGENGMELWTSDGTANGTMMVSDLATGKSFPSIPTKGTPVPPRIPVFPEGNSSNPSNLIVVDNVLYFQANDGTGAKLWQLSLDRAFKPERDDIVYGSFGDDTIDVGGGWNRVYAGEGDNFVTAGNGDDGIYGGSGTDIFFAGRGRNEINAGDGFNFVMTGTGYDRITTGDGNDIIIAGNGFNSIIAGEGKNLVIGGNNGNHVYLGAGDDYVFTGSSHDRIYAGIGNNYINAGNGWNTIYLENGQDTIVLTQEESPNPGEPVIDGFNIIKNFDVTQDQLIFQTIFPIAFSKDDLSVRQINNRWGYYTEISTQSGDVLAHLDGIHVTADQLRFSAKPDAVGGTIKQFAAGLLESPSLTSQDRSLLQTAGVDRLFNGFPTGPFS